jgi:hypothetical protein
MTKATLTTATEILSILAYAKLPYTEVDIPQVVVDLLALEVEELLAKAHALPTAYAAITDMDDIRARGFLWGAHVCMVLEGLGGRGQIETSSGDISESKVGNVTTQFQRWQPMFFFAKGMAQGFYELLPHKTYLMKAMQMVRAWKAWNFSTLYPGEVAWGTVVANLGIDNKPTYYPTMASLDTVSLIQEFDWSVIPPA